MSTRRVFLSPTVGLRCSLAGFDAVTGSSDQMSFDTSWTDISKLLLVGVASWVSDIGVNPSFAVPGFAVAWADQGYIPFAEIRRLSGNVVRDDYWNSSFQYGSYTRVRRTGFSVSESSTSDKVLYIVHQIPVPSG